MGPQYDVLNNGKKVFFTGFVTVNQPPSDMRLHVHPTLMHQPLFERNVEVHAWKQTMTEIEERDGNRVRRGRKFTYTPSWMNADSCPDSANFSDKSKVNIMPSIKSETFYCG